VLEFQEGQKDSAAGARAPQRATARAVVRGFVSETELADVYQLNNPPHCRSVRQPPTHAPRHIPESAFTASCITAALPLLTTHGILRVYKTALNEDV
jgi:hypothetical protein